MAITSARGASKPKRHPVDVRGLAGGDAGGEDIDITEHHYPLGREALEVVMAWAVIGIFAIAFFAILHYMALILIPVTLAIVVGLILGLAADRLGQAGVPRFGIALILSTLVFAVLFLIINFLAEPVSTLVREGPSFIERTADRIMPFLERQRWLNVSPATFETGPMSMQSLLENSSNILGVVTSSLTPAIIQGLIFFAALLLFLYGRVRLRRTVILAFPTRRQRLIAIRVLNAIDQVLGYYFATASILYFGLGIIMTLIAYFSGLAMPVLWGLFAFLSSFVPFLGITLMTISVAIAGILTHEALFIGLIPAVIFFSVHLVMENLIFPAIMGRQWEINPFIVFLAILFWTWMWGAVGAMLALPLSLIMMTVLAELFPERKTTPNLPG
ncbi:AI-2E family transporter [Neorhizobium sp. Rsf11]|uniref:AI-2E family transporter n=2 Tax=Neorhizobium TaxID=1525371 RepID=A0ABV0M849_9HYPH|nr:AI-2E family transporter [Neorhizobium petrolearium]MCC2608976.1 AI-2E family transporter [Neorhizobium petrolearium]WGI69218.1 AI-2E family transporter [Neorhizobium petrolearium]